MGKILGQVEFEALPQWVWSQLLIHELHDRNCRYAKQTLDFVVWLLERVADMKDRPPM